MGRLTEILCSAHTETIPTNEQLFHIDIGEYETRRDIKELRKQARKAVVKENLTTERKEGCGT
jgi:hypothetical protein